MHSQQKVSSKERRLLATFAHDTGLKPWDIVSDTAISKYYGEQKAQHVLNISGPQFGRCRYARLLAEKVGQIPIESALKLTEELNAALPNSIDRQVVIEPVGVIARTILVPMPRLLEAFPDFALTFGESIQETIRSIKSEAKIPPEKLSDDVRYSGSTEWETIHSRAHLIEKLFWAVEADDPRRLAELMDRFGLDFSFQLNMEANPFSYHRLHSKLECQITYPDPYSFAAVRDLAEALGGEIVQTNEQARAMLGYPEYVVEYSPQNTSIMDVAMETESTDVIGFLLERGANPKPYLIRKNLSTRVSRLLKDAATAQDTEQIFLAPSRLIDLISRDETITVHRVIDGIRIVEADVEDVNRRTKDLLELRRKAFEDLKKVGLPIPPLSDSRIHKFHASLLKPKKVKDYHHTISVMGKSDDTEKLIKLNTIARRISEVDATAKTGILLTENKLYLHVWNAEYKLNQQLEDEVRYK